MFPQHGSKSPEKLIIPPYLSLTCSLSLKRRRIHHYLKVGHVLCKKLGGEPGIVRLLQSTHAIKGEM